jgi:hypothetical protein
MPALPSQGTFLNWFPRKYRPANGASADAPRGRRATSFDLVRPPGCDTNVVLNTSSGSNAPCTHSSACARHVFPRLSAPPRAPPHFQTFDPPLSLRISADIIPTRLDRRFNPDGCHRSRAGSARRRQGTTLTDADPPPAASRGARRPTRDDTRAQPRDPRIDPQEHSFLGSDPANQGSPANPFARQKYIFGR